AGGLVVAGVCRTDPRGNVHTQAPIPRPDVLVPLHRRVRAALFDDVCERGDHRAAAGPAPPVAADRGDGRLGAAGAEEAAAPGAASPAVDREPRPARRGRPGPYSHPGEPPLSPAPFERPAPELQAAGGELMGEPRVLFLT